MRAYAHTIENDFAWNHIHVAVRPETDPDYILIWQSDEYASVAVLPDEIDTLITVLQEARQAASPDTPTIPTYTEDAGQ